MKVFTLDDSGYEHDSIMVMLKVPDDFDENHMYSLRSTFEELVGYKPTDMYEKNRRSHETIVAQRIQAMHKLLELGLYSLDEEDNDILINNPTSINQIFSIGAFLIAFGNWLVANHGQ